jgi:hypothetical protein
MSANDIWNNNALTIKLKGLCISVDNLKKGRKVMWGAVTLFSVVVVFMLGVRADVKDATAYTRSVRETHTLEYRDLERVFRNRVDTLENNINVKLFDINKELGSNGTSHVDIAARLTRIEKKLDGIAEYQRGHK